MTAAIAVLLTLAQEDPDIIPDPDGEPRPSNIGGLVVALVLIAAWLVAGYVLFRRARRRP
jgi:hypothetical protein